MRYSSPLNNASLTAEFIGRPVALCVRADGEDLSFERRSRGEHRAKDFLLRINMRPVTARSALIDIELTRGGKPFKLEAVRLSVALPAVEVHRFRLARPAFHCGQMSRSSYIWWLQEFASANIGIPFIMAYSRRGINKGFIGYVDQVRDTHIRHDTTHHHSGPDEETIQLIWLTLQRPNEGQTLTTDCYKDTVFLSLEARDQYRVLQDYVGVVEAERPASLPSVPDACTEPVWCSWYAFRARYGHDEIVENARLAAELGFRNVIMDANASVDGEWLYGGAGKTAAALRELGLRAVLWVAPYALRRSMPEYDKFSHLVAVLPDGKSSISVCPMAEGAAEFVSERVRSLMKDNSLDGLKLDFLDRPDLWNCAADHKHIYQTLGEGADACMAAMHRAITKVKSDAIIEFRQNYTNINNRKYGNCFRGNDAPYDFDQIRRETFQVWPYAKGVPVHADYAYWHPSEPLSNKAIFMACVTYGCVPTLSMDLRNFTDEESRLVKAWLDFYTGEKGALLRGSLIPMSLDPHFSISRIESSRKTVFGLFSGIAPSLLELSNDPSEIIVINGTDAPHVFTRISNVRGEFSCLILDPFHQTVEEFAVDSDDDLCLDFPVPVGGLIRLNRA